ncbi:MAG TPA: 3-phosphoshikimate 1-carboxyvinyltransferase [Gammaproteobacteria bacterium]|nr:3-phosphoshikimate 1-carboxyvinyltransferase [Gammaproteobacteria bacterium]
MHKTSIFTGQVTAPSSKSQSVRGLLFALLASGKSTLTNVLASDDTQHAIQVCKDLGATITQAEGKIIVESRGIPLPSTAQLINTGNSGITTRFIMPILGLRYHPQQPIILDCNEQMRSRPIRSLATALTALGMTCAYQGQAGSCPIAVSGELQGGIAEVEGITSQYLSALLIALPCAPQDSEIRVHDLHERPYVELTLSWLQEQGIYFEHQRLGKMDIYKIRGKHRYQPFQKTIMGDFSSASYLLAAASLFEGSVTLQGLDMSDSQGDKQLIDILQKMGADIRVNRNDIIVHGGKPLQGIAIDANEIPDLLPTLAVLGVHASGETRIYNVPQARIKETDRIHSMTEGLRRLGAKVEEFKDGLTVSNSQLRGAVVEGYDDHRTVMALALAGMQAEGETVITQGEAINKTFPTFVSLMCSLGAKMELINVAQ